MENSNEFWNDERVKEFHLSFFDKMEELNTKMDSFKFWVKNREASKQSVPLDWEIVSLKGKSSGNIYKKDSETKLWLDHNQNGFSLDPSKDLSDCAIHSVRRIKDGEVFTVGDETTDGVIKRMWLVKNVLCIGCEKLDSEQRITGIKNISHTPAPLKESKPLFKNIGVRLIETDSKFLEGSANVISGYFGEWFYMPFWFKKISDGVYHKYNFEDLPEDLKNAIKERRQ